MPLVDGGPNGRGGPRRLGTLRRERVTVRRGAVLADAEVLMQHHSRHKSVLEVLFQGEEVRRCIIPSTHQYCQ